MTPKFKKSFGGNINAKFDVFMETRCDLIIEADNKLFKNRKQKTTFVLCSFQKLLNSKLNRLSLKEIECKNYHTDYPGKYNCFELVYCGHPKYPHTNILRKKTISSLRMHSETR